MAINEKFIQISIELKFTEKRLGTILEYVASSCYPPFTTPSLLFCVPARNTRRRDPFLMSCPCIVTERSVKKLEQEAKKKKSLLVAALNKGNGMSDYNWPSPILTATSNQISQQRNMPRSTLSP